jgi:crossover junction endodeoxyribonuclease RuvC
MSKTGLPALRILGVDPGLRVTGFGVIEKVGSRLRYLASGCIRTQVSDSLPTRLGTIHTGLRELVAKHRPDEAATEIVFVNVNPQSTLLLGQARGAAISALVTSGLAVAEYTALQVKQAVVGNGHADKVQVQHMVLACAIAHAHGGHGLGNLAAGGLQVRGGRLILGKAIGQQGGNER